MKSALIVFILLVSQNVFAKRPKVSFQKLGNYVQTSAPTYEFDFKERNKGYRITRFCNQEGHSFRTVENPNSNYNNCLDSSQPATSDDARSEGVMIQIQ